MRFSGAAFLIVLLLIAAGVGFLSSRGQPALAQTDELKTQRHFKIERPADLDPAGSLTIYDNIGGKMARGYRASGDPLATDYRKWRRYNTAPYRSATHGNRYVNNYGNARASGYGKLKDGEKMPEGAALVKDSFTVTGSGDVFSGALFIMEKLAAGADAAYGDWRYVMILPDGSLFGDSRGDNADKVAFCDGCHKAMAETDRLFFLPKPYRRVFFQVN